VQGRNQVLGIDGLGQEVVTTQAHGVQLFADVLFRRQVNDGNTVETILLADDTGNLHAGAAGHVHVQDDDFRRELLQGMNDLHRVGDDVSGHSRLFQYRFHVFGLGPGIVQDQTL